MPADPPGDQAPDTALQRIAEAAKKLKTAAGNPSYRAISLSIASNEDEKRTSGASHTCVGWIMKAARLTSWPVLDTVVRELVRMSKEPVPQSDSPADKKARQRRLADEQSLHFHILWLEARQEKETGVSEDLRARERFSLHLHKLVIEPFNGVPRVSEALRSLDAAEEPDAAFLADRLPEIVSGSRTPQLQHIDTLIRLCCQSGKSISPADAEDFRSSYAELLRWTSPAMYELLQHHQAKARDHAEQVERLEDEARARSRDEKPADLEVFHRSSARSKADNERLVARVKTLETRVSKLQAKNQELLERLRRYEPAGADTPSCVVRVDSIDVLHGPMIPDTTPTGRPAEAPEQDLRATIPSWADIAPRQQPVAHFDASAWSEFTPDPAAYDPTGTWTIPSAPNYSPTSPSGTEFAYSAYAEYSYGEPEPWPSYASTVDLLDAPPFPAGDPLFGFPDQKHQVAISENAVHEPSPLTSMATGSWQPIPESISNEMPPMDEEPPAPPSVQQEEARNKKPFLRSFFKRGRGKHARQDP